MPPRFAFWTILIDNVPTAFRAREQEELLPTLSQLRRKNSNVTLKWFARGRLWDSPEAAHQEEAQHRPAEKRGRDWRPGGVHKDPRDRFKKKNQARPWREDRDGQTRPPRQDRRSPAFVDRPESDSPPNPLP